MKPTVAFCQRLACLGCILAAPLAPILRAFPPAPHHLVHGTVRDELGHPLSPHSAEVILETSSGRKIVTRISKGLEPGVNYEIGVPMDAGITADLYKPTALRPAIPFKIRVRIGQTSYLPIEMTGDFAHLGEPGQRTRLNLTLGEDADGDGIPDAWERLAQGAGGSLADFRPGDDLDGDGLSNLDEYLAGTYALDPADGFTLKILPNPADQTVLEFTAIRGRTYTVLGSADLQNWSPVAFRLRGATTPPAATYQATDVRPIQVETDPGTSRELRFFKLVVQ